MFENGPPALFGLVTVSESFIGSSTVYIISSSGCISWTPLTSLHILARGWGASDIYTPRIKPSNHTATLHLSGGADEKVGNFYCAFLVMRLREPTFKYRPFAWITYLEFSNAGYGFEREVFDEYPKSVRRNWNG